MVLWTTQLIPAAKNGSLLGHSLLKKKKKVPNKAHPGRVQLKASVWEHLDTFCMPR